MFPFSRVDKCKVHHTKNYGSSRIQNKNFEFPFAHVPDDVTSFEIAIRGNKDAYITLSPKKKLPNDKKGAKGVTKIGKCNIILIIKQFGKTG